MLSRRDPLGNELSSGESDLRRALRATAHVSWSVATLGHRWKYLSSDKDKTLRKRMENFIFLNFTVNSWLNATGFRYKDIDPRLTSIMKNYFVYVAAADRFLDSPENRDRSMKFNKDSEIRETRKRFFESIRLLDNAKQKEIRTLFTVDAEVMMRAINEHRNIRSLSDAEELRMGTSGVVVGSHIRLLNTIYSVPTERARVIEDAYMNLGMVAQVQDDLLDLKDDMAKGIDENLIYQILLQNPGELKQVKELLERERISYKRLVRNAPVTAREAKKMQDKYVQRITDPEILDRLDSALYLRELERNLVYVIGI